MVPRIFLASAIDEDESRGSRVRSYYSNLIKECGCEVLGAGIGENPIISTSSPRSVCKSIIRHDLNEQFSCHATLVVTDGKTLAVGTWIELWEAYKLGQFIILFVENSREVKSIFLKGLVDISPKTELELRQILVHLSRELGN